MGCTSTRPQNAKLSETPSSMNGASSSSSRSFEPKAPTPVPDIRKPLKSEGSVNVSEDRRACRSRSEKKSLDPDVPAQCCPLLPCCPRRSTGQIAGKRPETHVSLHRSETAKVLDHPGAGYRQLSPGSSWIQDQNIENMVEVLPEFLNTMMAFTWPMISEFAMHTAKHVIEPDVKTALGSLGKHFSFAAEHSNLGRTPLQCSRVRLGQTQQATNQGDIQNVLLSCSIEWDVPLQMMCSFSGMELGINRMSLKGELIIECVHMVAKIPMFKGVRAFFSDIPDLDLSFGGRGSAMLELRVVKDTLLECVRKQLCQKMLAPNKMGILFDKSEDYFRILKPAPIGILTLTVVRACQLIAEHVHFKGPSTSDPFVKIRCGATRVQCAALPRTVNPVFNWEVRLLITHAYQQQVYIEIWDENKMTGHDFLGKLSLNVAQAAALGSRPISFQLEDEGGVPGGRGNLYLTGRYSGLTLEPTRVDDIAYLYCGVYSVAGVPWQDDVKKYWVTAACKCEIGCNGQSRPKISPKKKRVRPVVDEAEAVRLKRRVELLRKYNVDASDLSEILGIDESTLQSKSVKDAYATKYVDDNLMRELQKNYWKDIDFNHAFDFLVERVADANIDLEFWCHSHGGNKILGRCRCPVSPLLKAPSCTDVSLVSLAGTSFSLKVKLQLRFPVADSSACEK